MENVKLMLVILLSAILAIKADAQKVTDTTKKNAGTNKRKNEIGIGKGFNMQFFGVDLDHLKKVSPDHPYQVVMLHYRHYVSKDLTFGASAGYAEYSDNADYNTSFYSITPEVTWSYYNKAENNNKIHVRLYGLASMGVVFVDQHYSGTFHPANSSEKSTNFVSFQTTPIGISVDKSCGGFVEFGF